MLHIQLDDVEVAEVEMLLAGLLREYERLDSDAFLRDATVWSHQLPRRLREQANALRLIEPDDGLLLVSGLPIDDDRIGPTPRSLESLPTPPPTRREESFLMLVAVLLGDLIAWSTQQSGRVVHDVFPIREHRDMQLGTGCRQSLTWHTEDAFHPFRPDYVVMLCLRNPQHVPTTIASIASLDLDEETRDWLSKPYFTIRPDESHRGITDIGGAGPKSGGKMKIADQLESPVPIPVLTGSRAHPYWCLDPYFMPPPDVAGARQALQTLIDRVDASMVDVVLKPGDVCVMDNYRVVHGRRPFEARFDGTDRWLKRVLVARDLRKSITARSGAQSRVID